MQLGTVRQRRVKRRLTGQFGVVGRRGIWAFSRGQRGDAVVAGGGGGFDGAGGRAGRRRWHGGGSNRVAGQFGLAAKVVQGDVRVVGDADRLSLALPHGAHDEVDDHAEHDETAKTTGDGADDEGPAWTAAALLFLLVVVTTTIPAAASAGSGPVCLRRTLTFAGDICLFDRVCNAGGRHIGIGSAAVVIIDLITVSQ